ncbi:unnamed protein product [Vitrella brassicaformis CCMP3155]|uniref:Uncharacterized protein n=1 Tax=Vitrella brassicaformis (strain CCMP3155) TaxID=1169540 RepID=A0A0G4EZI4_VITBC|nr:unnamed protein product [Vitrella brassicaformis CCMP3155]|eukprot:CEM04220.1 unnamed protein product [Vitrella brassicaformis CCMP3155]
MFLRKQCLSLPGPVNVERDGEEEWVPGADRKNKKSGGRGQKRKLSSVENELNDFTLNDGRALQPSRRSRRKPKDQEPSTISQTNSGLPPPSRKPPAPKKPNRLRNCPNPCMITCKFCGLKNFHHECPKRPDRTYCHQGPWTYSSKMVWRKVSTLSAASTRDKWSPNLTPDSTPTGAHNTRSGRSGGPKPRCPVGGYTHPTRWPPVAAQRCCRQ